MSAAQAPSPRSQYVQAVWQAFAAKRGPSTQACSPAEWGLVATWYDAGWPLRIVLRGIKDHVGGMTPRTTLAYVAPAVAEAVRQWYRAQVL